MADVVKALVHLVGIAMVGVRVPAGATIKGRWVDPCPNSPKKYNNTGRSRCKLRSELNKRKNKNNAPQRNLRLRRSGYESNIFYVFVTTSLPCIYGKMF